MNELALVDIHVAGGAKAPGHVRAVIERELGDLLDERSLGDVRLLTSEVVTNSVIHGGVDEAGWVRTSISMPDGRVRVEVRDSGLAGEPSPRDPGSLEAGGYGLQLVNMLAAEWGIERDPYLCVWFELELD